MTTATVEPAAAPPESLPVAPVPPPRAGGEEAALRQHLSDLRGLLALSMLMTSRQEEDEIVHVVVTAVPALMKLRAIGVRLVDEERTRWVATAGAAEAAGVRASLVEQLHDLPVDGGEVTVPGEAWAWALPLRSVGVQIGMLVVAADGEPTATEMLLLRSLGQQTGIALANARLHARNQRTNAELACSLEELRDKTAIHDALTQVAVSGAGQDGVVAALHELTGLAVCVESPGGDVVAWAGPGPAQPWSATGARREQVVQRALRVGHPIRVDGRLLTAIRPRPDVLGLLALIDPDATAGDKEVVALEHGRTVLAIELARLHSVAETERRLGRDLAADLLDGAGDDTHHRARALGYDLGLPHRVVVAAPGRGQALRDPLLLDAQAAVAQAFAPAEGPRPLVLQRARTVVAIVAAQEAEDPGRLEALVGVLGPGARLGVGGRCTEPTQVPRGHRQGVLALRIAERTGSTEQVLRYDDLGVYRLLAEDADPGGLDDLVERWLGPLVAYDAQRDSDLVATLAVFLDLGGGYDATAQALTIGRTTVRYRLRRIRELTGHDLGDPETRFQVHLALKAWATREALR